MRQQQRQKQQHQQQQQQHQQQHQQHQQQQQGGLFGLIGGQATATINQSHPSQSYLQLYDDDDVDDAVRSYTVYTK